MPYENALARVIDEVIAPGAGEVDAAGVFPGRQIEALAGAGLLGLTVPAEFSGGPSSAAARSAPPAPAAGPRCRPFWMSRTSPPPDSCCRYSARAPSWTCSASCTGTRLTPSPRT